MFPFSFIILKTYTATADTITISLFFLSIGDIY